MSGTSFVFDSKGYFYTFAKLTESAVFIKSTKPDFGSKTHDNTYYSGAMYLDVNYGSCMTIDRVNDFLYFLDTGYGYVYQITGDDGEYIFKSSNAYDSAKKYSFTNDTNRRIIQSANTFAIYDRVAYFGSFYEDSSLHLVIADLKNAAPGDSDNDYLVDGSKDIDLGASEMGLSSNASIVDMLYQDGAVYMLVSDKYEDFDINNDVNDNPTVLEGEIINRGTVVKYDLISGETAHLPFETTATSQQKIYPLVDAAGGNYCKIFNRDYNYDTPEASTYTPILYDVTEHTDAKIDVYSHVSKDTSSKVLYSPKKFIAIRPKKLIIADDGIAYYVDSLGGLRYKNENRVVEVDLESFAISKVEVASVAFSEDTEGDITIQAGNMVEVYCHGTQYFYAPDFSNTDAIDDNGYVFTTGNNGGNFFPGILSEED